MLMSLPDAVILDMDGLMYDTERIWQMFWSPVLLKRGIWYDPAQGPACSATNGKVKQEWHLKSSHADNHYFDCEVYCMAAADIMGIRTAHLNDEAEEQQRQQPVQNSPPTHEETWIQKNESWL